MQKIKKSQLVIIRLHHERRMKIIKRKEVDPSDFSGVYQDMIQNLGVEVTKKIHKFYKGQQVTFPMRLYSKNYILKKLEQYDGTNLKALSKELGYSERWLRHLIETLKEEKSI